MRSSIGRNATRRDQATPATRRGALLVACAAVCWSSGGLIARLVPTSPWTTSPWRRLSASIFLALLLWVGPRRRPRVLLGGELPPPPLPRPPLPRDRDDAGGGAGDVDPRAGGPALRRAAPDRTARPRAAHSVRRGELRHWVLALHGRRAVDPRRAECVGRHAGDRARAALGLARAERAARGRDPRGRRPHPGCAAGEHAPRRRYPRNSSQVSSHA